jgi:hypothetical protein
MRMTLADNPRKAGLAQDLSFFLGVPLLLCACMTIAGPYALRIGVVGAFVYVAMMSFIPWWIAGLTTYVVQRQWGKVLPLWLIAAAGALIAGPLVLAYAMGVDAIAETWWPALPAASRIGTGIERWQAFALSEGRSVVLWVAFVLIYTETFGWKRYRTAAGTAPVAENRFQLSGSQWTDADDARLQMLVAEGLPPRDIAMRMQRTYGAVRARTARLGLKNNRP